MCTIECRSFCVIVAGRQAGECTSSGPKNRPFSLEDGESNTLFGSLAEYVDGDAIDEAMDRCPGQVE